MDPQSENSTDAKTFRCPDCGAVNLIGKSQCYLCDRKFDAGETSFLTPQTAANRDFSTAQPSARGMSTYSLSSLFLIVTLAAICFGFIAQAPGLAIPIIVLITPALLSTFVKSRKKRAAGGDFTTADKVQAFFMSVGAVLLTIFAGAAAFFAACFVSCATMMNSNSDRFLIVSLIVSAAFGIFIMVVTAIQFWKLNK
jgi:hypothetical protein